jgi:uncharacterized membrane protein HdeD (DUF308 family)
MSSDKRVDESATENENARKRTLFAAFPIVCIISGIVLILYGDLADNGVIISFGWVFVTVGIIMEIILLSTRPNRSDR